MNPSRKRSRAFLAVSLVATTSSVSSFTATARFPNFPPLHAMRTATSTEETIAQVDSYYEYDSYYDGVAREEALEEFFNEAATSVTQLVDSTGPEVLDDALQASVENGPREYLESMDATPLERMAMGTISSQLPKAAVDHFQDRHEMTLELARIIQQGAALQALKCDDKHAWAQAAGLTTRQLRKQVSAYRRAKHELVTANMGLLRMVVRQLYPMYVKNGISKEEMMQEGTLGLLRAAELFDPSRGLKFSTYAVVWIKGVLSQSHATELVRVPQREKTLWNKVRKVKSELERVGPVSVEALAAACEVHVSELLKLQRNMASATKVFSLDYETEHTSRSGADHETVTLSNRIADEEEMEAHIQLRADVLSAMSANLDKSEARLMRLRYGLHDGYQRTYLECADAMGISVNQVRRLSKKCFEKLQAADEASSLEEYLLTIA